MTSGLIVSLELLGVLGVVLGLAGWELWRLRRDRRAAEQPLDNGRRAGDASPPRD